MLPIHCIYARGHDLFSLMHKHVFTMIICCLQAVLSISMSAAISTLRSMLKERLLETGEHSSAPSSRAATKVIGESQNIQDTKPKNARN